MKCGNMHLRSALLSLVAMATKPQIDIVRLGRSSYQFMYSVVEDAAQSGRVETTFAPRAVYILQNF